MWVTTCLMLGVVVVAVGGLGSVGAQGSVLHDQLRPKSSFTYQDAPTPIYIPSSHIVGFHDNGKTDTMTDTYSHIYNYPDNERHEADVQYNNQHDHHYNNNYNKNATQTGNPDQNEIPVFENLDQNEIPVFENPDKNEIPVFENLDKNRITDSPSYLLDLISGNSTDESGRELYYDSYDRRRDMTIFRKVKTSLESLFGTNDRYGSDRQGLGLGDSSIGAAIIGLSLVTQVLTAAAFLSSCDEDEDCVTSCDNSELLCTAQCQFPPGPLLPCTPITTCEQQDPVCTTICSRRKRDTSLLDVGIVQRAAESLSDSSFGDMFRSLSFNLPFAKETGRTICNMARQFMF